MPKPRSAVAAVSPALACRHVAINCEETRVAINEYSLIVLPRWLDYLEPNPDALALVADCLHYHLCLPSSRCDQSGDDCHFTRVLPYSCISLKLAGR
jgi:hypothetical protein